MGSASRFHQSKRDPINQKGGPPLETISIDLAVDIIFDFTFNIEVRRTKIFHVNDQKVDIFRMKSLNLVQCEQ